MRTFGLDLSTIASGWALFDGDKLLRYGVIKPDKDLNQTEKYFYITQTVVTLWKLYRPTDLSIEDTFIHPDPKKANPASVKKLNRIAGQIMYAWYLLTRKEAAFYMASSARGAINVSGRADKKEVTAGVNKFFKLRGRVKDDNMADAIVVGYKHVVENQG